MNDFEQGIEAANAEFYKAIEAGSIERMDEVWANEEWVRCVHPGWEMISSWKRVRESWLRIFEAGQKMRISPSEIVITLFSEIGLINCTENITVFGEDQFESLQATATNLFIRRGESWLLVHHHASPVPALVPDQSSDVIQ